MEYVKFDNGNYETYKKGCEILKLLNIYFYKHSRYTEILLFDDEYDLLLGLVKDYTDNELETLYNKFLDNPHSLKDCELASLFIYLFE